MTRADTIARHLNQAGEHLKAAVCAGNPQVYATSGPALSIDAAMRCINAAFLEALGGAAVAGEAAGPWVVRVVVDDASVWWASNGAGLPRRQRLDEAARFFSVEEAANMAGLYVEIGHRATVLPLAEAERMEAAATLASLPAHTQQVLAELGDKEPSAEVLAADDSPDSAPEPPKPAGWVVRWGIPGSYRFSQGIGVELGVSDPTDAHVYTSKADAEADARTVKHEVCVLPVDAAGNVIEAEDIGATLRREECERKAARQSGVAWEAARAGEEAERLRTDLAAVKAERDEVRAERDKWAANAGTLNASLRQVHTECDQLRAELDATLAERDALAAEVQRAKEQKPVHLALVNEQGAVVDGYLIKTRALAEDDARRRACTVAPLYLAPPLRDVSGVIAQCEEALREWDREGPRSASASSLVAVTLTKARNALRGAS